MSQVYSTEPQTTGRVILNTTNGPIDINLWCKECPTTTRAFLQLCMDGYYNGMIFHRIINNFLIQSGEKRKGESEDEKNKQNEMIEKYMSTYALGQQQQVREKDEAIPGSEEFITRKKLELSPRIRFNHRGQVAMALPLDDDNVEAGKESSSLARQFFITMDEAPFLQSKYVIFGTVSGDTIFNAMRIGRTETIDEESGELVDVENAPMIKDVRIEHHLYDDLVMTKEENVPWKIVLNKTKTGEETMSEVTKRRKKRKGKKDLNVLSFGNEFMDDGDEEVTSGILSSHDVLKKRGMAHTTLAQSNKKQKLEPNGAKVMNKVSCEEELNDCPVQLETVEEVIYNIKTKSQVVELPNGIIDNHYNNHVQSDSNNDEKKISAVEARRMKYLKSKTDQSQKGTKSRDDHTMSKLSAFRSKMFAVKGTDVNKGIKEPIHGDDFIVSTLKKRDSNSSQKSFSSKLQAAISAPIYSGQILEDNETYEHDYLWMKNRFKCKRHVDHDSKDKIGGDSRNVEDYEVIDDKHNRNTNNNTRKYNRRHSRRR